MSTSKNKFHLPNETISVLLVDDEVTILDLLKGRLERKGFRVHATTRGAEALEIAPRFKPDVVVTDLRMPGLDGFEVLERMGRPTILITGHGDKESAIKAVEAGAYAFFEKPFDLEALENAIRRAAERGKLETERAELLQKLDSLCKLQNRELENLESKTPRTLIGESPALNEVKDLLSRLAVKPLASLLILGETGTGKEVVARALHDLTHTGEERTPFVPLNCAALPPDLFESELFGHEKGAFSGALSTKTGLAEAAREGTLFLDEIGEMAPLHQAKVLRLVQERSFRRVGGTKEIPFRARIVAATHRDLKSRITENHFREDLYYRLAVVHCTLPPLRDRGSDIMLIAEALALKWGLRGISPETLAELRSYHWPGNIRELSNFIERASILGQVDSQKFVLAPVPELETRPKAQTTAAAAPSPLNLKNRAENLGKLSVEIEGRKLKELRAQILEEIDRSAIEGALQRSAGNISQAAKILGLDRKNLTRRMKELAITLRHTA